MRLDDTKFINEIFCLVKRVFVHIENRESQEYIEESFQSFLHKSIEFMQTLDHHYVPVFGNIIHVILHADILLKYIDSVRKIHEFFYV